MLDYLKTLVSAVIPSWLPVGIALVVGAAAGGAGIWFIQEWRIESKIDRITSQVAQDALKAQEAARAKEEEFTKQQKEAQDAATKRETALRADADGARRSVDGLRGQLAELRKQLPGLADDSVRERADTLADILGQCSEEYRGLAEKADRHVSDKQKLMDSWPK